MLKLRYYQTEAVAEIYKSLTTSRISNPLIAMPTGTGKSVVIAEFVRSVLQQWPRQRILVCTHVKELLEQNCSKLLELWPSAPVGLYSAGLGRKEPNASVLFGGVASCFNAVEQIGFRDLLLIDEAHLLSNKSDSMYQTMIAKLKQKNPNLRVIGFTATPYRNGDGKLTDGGLFTDLVYDLTSLHAFNKLLSEGWLAPLYPKKTEVELDISNVSLSVNDFNQKQLQTSVDLHDVNYSACAEMVTYGAERKSWLLFASGIKHSEHLAKMLRNFGISAVAIHSEIGKNERKEALDDFRKGSLRCLVNNNVLTTGFDHPPIDFIGMLRPTTSTGLWVQMLGRGTRPSEGKNDCLVLDFAGNTKRLGPINDPVLPKRKGAGGTGQAPVKVCNSCGTYNACSVRFCAKCGVEFSFDSKLVTTADTKELIRSDLPEIEVFNVERVNYAKIDRAVGPPYMQAYYLCGTRFFKENIMLEDEGYASKKARDWWRERAGTEQAPPTIEDALVWASKLAVPSRIHVWTNKKYPEVMKAEGFKNVA